MASRRGFSPRVTARTKQRLSWDLGPGGGAPTGFSAATTGILGAGVSPLVGTITIRRLRGEILYSILSLAAATDRVRMTSGIAVVSTDAFVDVGATAMPDPDDDMAYPWLWWDTVLINPETTTVGLDGITSIRRVVDSKAMRIMREDQILAWMVQFLDESGTVSAAVGGNTRILVSV